MAEPRLTVAVVDDEKSVRKALGRLFRSAGMDVEAFAGGRDFLESLPHHAPDCLVLDLHLPGLTGLDLQRQLVETGARLPTVIITGKDEPGLRELAFAAGADAYLLKPFDDRDLLAAVTAAVRERAPGQENHEHHA